eukprot:5341262-Prymnesium_polylepis.2
MLSASRGLKIGFPTLGRWPPSLSPVDNSFACQSSAKSRCPQKQANPAKSTLSPRAAPELVRRREAIVEAHMTDTFSVQVIEFWSPRNCWRTSKNVHPDLCATWRAPRAILMVGDGGGIMQGVCLH